MRALSVAALVGLGTLATACTQTYRAPIDYGYPVETRAGAAGGAFASGVVVQRGDTVYAIARRYDVPVREVIGMNGLSPPYILHPGDRLQLPAKQSHIVRKGETVYGISRLYGVDMTALVRANNLGPPYTIDVGQRLDIPSRPAVRQASTVVRAPRPDRSPTLLGPPPQRSGSRFAWPVCGSLALAFGASGRGLHNDGINILAEAGSAVRAAENGVVAYAGNELAAYGNMLLVRHSDRWVTAYAHNETLLVGRGDTVTRGQVIARAGASGSVTTPQLHFEIRQGARAVNPLDHLAPREEAGCT